MPLNLSLSNPHTVRMKSGIIECHSINTDVKFVPCKQSIYPKSEYGYIEKMIEAMANTSAILTRMLNTCRES